jgi:hypothetical protein
MFYFIFYILRSLFYTPYYTFYTVHSTMYNLYFSSIFHIAQFIFQPLLIYILNTIFFIIQFYALYSALDTPHYISYTLHTTLYTLHSNFTLYALPTAHSTLHTLYSAFIILHPALYTTLHRTLHFTHSTLPTLLDDVALDDVDLHFAWQT